MDAIQVLPFKLTKSFLVDFALCKRQRKKPFANRCHKVASESLYPVALGFTRPCQTHYLDVCVHILLAMRCVYSMHVHGALAVSFKHLMNQKSERLRK